jgi:uncharacterized protein (DUF2147 family)
MRYALLFALLLAAGFPIKSAEASSPVGVWKTFDDDTHAVKALVEIVDHDGELSARIVQLFRDPGEEPNPLCKDCRGERHNQPVLGMTILWGMHRDGDAWDGGEILDPEEGKTYRCTLHLGVHGELEVRGYYGISLLGRTQVWERVER